MDPSKARRIVDAAVELVRRGGREGAVRVRGRSMEPTLRPGDVLAVDFDAAEPRPGDLVVFRQGDDWVVHRLVSRRGGRLRTRGDGTLTLDPRLARSGVLGRAVAVQTRDGSWRTLEGIAPRSYARCIALHDLCWGGLWSLASRVLRANGSDGARIRRFIATVDRTLIGWTHRALFRRVHRRIAAPAAESEPESTGHRGPG